MREEFLVSPSGCVEIQRTVEELINNVQQEENKFFYQECLRLQIDPEALLKCEKKILEQQEEIKLLQRERDAAVNDLERNCECTICKHYKSSVCKDCMEKTSSNGGVCR